MAKITGKKTMGHSGSTSKQLLLAVVSFIFGYVSASLFDATSLSTWVNKQLLAQQNGQNATKSVTQQAHLPPPKYEFYTLLTSGQREVVQQPIKSAPVVSAVPTVPTMPTAVTVASNEHSITKTPNAVSVPPSPVKSTVATPVSVVAAKPISTHAGALKGAYFVQVAAFRSNQEAERMKAALVMKGFSVTISMIQQQRVNWYRVNLGPYGSMALAQNAQTAIARRAHINGMVRKLDA